MTDFLVRGRGGTKRPRDWRAKLEDVSRPSAPRLSREEFAAETDRRFDELMARRHASDCAHHASFGAIPRFFTCLLYTSPSPRDS